MRVSDVPKPIPNQAIVQIQKNSIIRRIELLEKNKSQDDRLKIAQLKIQLDEIDKKHENQKRIEKEELKKALYNDKDKKELNRQNDYKAMNKEQIFDKKPKKVKARRTLLGAHIDKRF